MNRHGEKYRREKKTDWSINNEVESRSSLRYNTEIRNMRNLHTVIDSHFEYLDETSSPAVIDSHFESLEHEASSSTVINNHFDFWSVFALSSNKFSRWYWLTTTFWIWIHNFSLKMTHLEGLEDKTIFSVKQFGTKSERQS